VFERYTRWILAGTSRGLWLVGVLSVFSLLCATQLKINPNILDLLPAEEPTTIAVRKLNAEEGEVGTLTIGLKGEEQAVLDALAFLATRFKALDSVEYAVYDIPEEWKARLGPLQLSTSELKHLRGRIQQGLSLGPAAMSPMISGQLFDLGPLTEKLLHQEKNLSFGRGGVYRLLVRPTGSPFDPSFSKPFWEQSNKILDEAQLSSRNVEIVWLGGAYRHAVEDTEVIITDISKTAAISLFLVLSLVTISFRDVRAIGILFIPLLVGAIFTWGLAAVLIGELNTFTSTFTAILFGLGVDFSIHLYMRYREEFAELGDVDEAIIRAVRCAGPPCFVAAVTSAGGFLALTFAGFVGFQQLGILLAGGVLLCLFAVVTTLPLMIRWLDSRKKDISLLRPPFRAKVEIKYRRSGLVLAVVILFGALSWTVIPKIAFEYDLSELRPDGMAYDELSDEERMLARQSFRPLVLTVDTEEELLELHNKLSKIIEEETSPYIQGIYSLFSILPPDQKQRVAELQAISSMAGNPNIVYLPDLVQKNLKSLQETKIRLITKKDIPSELLGIIGADKGKHRLILFPDGNMWDIRENNNLAKEVERIIGKDVEAAGEYLAMASLFRLIKKDSVKVSIIALSLVFLISLLDVRSIKRAISSVFILLIGMSWAGAGMFFFNIKLSLVNFVGIPIMMGIGIDVIIHLVHRIAEEGPGRIRFALRTTGFAALISASTTVLSFASLLFASHRGLHSMGKMIVVGLTLVTLAAFIAVPLGWMRTWFRRKQAPPE
jgi:uncharacterized protein